MLTYQRILELPLHLLPDLVINVVAPEFIWINIEDKERVSMAVLACPSKCRFSFIGTAAAVGSRCDKSAFTIAA